MLVALVTVSVTILSPELYTFVGTKLSLPRNRIQTPSLKWSQLHSFGTHLYVTAKSCENDQRCTELTNHGDADSSIVSCANFVDRNTGVHSICINSDVEHT